MTILENFAHKYPAFVTQLVAVIRGKKPVVRIDFELHDDYVGLIDLLVSLNLVWFEHSSMPVRICYPSSLQRSKEIRVKAYPWYSETESYRFLRFFAHLSEYEKFWESLTEGELIPLELEGGDLHSLFETVIAKDFEGLMNFLTQYAIAKTHFAKAKQSEIQICDRILGTAFGYPDCCTERFIVERQRRRSKEDYFYYENIIEEGVENSIPVELRAVAHVPCSVLCQQSINLGREYFSELKDYDSKVHDIVMKELMKPTLFIDLWHQFSVTELNHKFVNYAAEKGKKEFLNMANTEAIEIKEVIFGRIEHVPFQYLSNFIGVWWIGVDPGNAVLLYNLETGEKRLYKKHKESNIADLRFFRYKL
ncbi:MAG: DUF483 domain-containing protein [Candidatus Bathyarchaeia archaeon]